MIAGQTLNQEADVLNTSKSLRSVTREKVQKATDESPSLSGNAGCNALCLVTSLTAGGFSGATYGSDDGEHDRDSSVLLREERQIV